MEASAASAIRGTPGMAEDSEIDDARRTAELDQVRAAYRELAEVHRAIFDSYVTAGFSRVQALELTIARIEAGY